MICPKDRVQMFQASETEDPNQPIGGGTSTDNEYTTWELKECPVCGRHAIEFYTALVVNDTQHGEAIAECLERAVSELPHF